MSDITEAGPRLKAMNDALESNILADCREWADEHLEQHVSTHSDRCHLWHERCMIHRLAAEIERLREAIRRLAEQDATLSVQGGNVTVTMDATLTDAERDAISYYIDGVGGPASRIATLRGLLERTK